MSEKKIEWRDGVMVFKNVTIFFKERTFLKLQNYIILYNTLHTNWNYRIKKCRKFICLIRITQYMN